MGAAGLTKFGARATFLLAFCASGHLEFAS
jgi:hypothetical protein